MSDPIAPLVTSLHQQGRLRVWSLIITVFGDLVQHRGGEVSSTRLGLLLDRVGVERGAIRTALSRLGRDGWVTRTRQGRTSLYRLSAQGMARFAPATSRIYAPPLPVGVTNWAVDINLSAGSAAQPAPEITLRPAEHPGGGADLRLSGALDHLSDAYRESLLVPSHRRALDVLAHDLEALHRAPVLELLDAAAARLLLVHRWRRIVLRYEDIWPDLMPKTAPLRAPRTRVADAYHMLSPRAEAWLDSATGDLKALPPPDTQFAARFVLEEQA